MNKPLVDMDYSELHRELAAAQEQLQAAEYVDGLDAYNAAKEAAQERKEAVEKEIDRRLDMLRSASRKDGASGR